MSSRDMAKIGCLQFGGLVACKSIERGLSFKCMQYKIQELENIGTYHNLRTYVIEYLWIMKPRKTSIEIKIHDAC